MSIGSVTQTGATNNATSSLNKLSNDLDSFLLILTTQLQNQDPLSPLDTHEFTNQLVQFANVEQSIQQSGYLEEMINLQKSNEVIGAVAYVGKTVEVDYNEFHKPANEGATMKYTLPEGVKSASIMILNADGDVVGVSQAESAAGEHSYTWDGKNSKDEQVPAGAYTFQVNAVDEDNNPIEKGISYSVTGPVTGVEYGDGKTILQMNSVLVDLSKVKAVTEPPASSGS